MKKFLRRSGAALLAACTVWVVIATVESNSVAAAATALRDSFHLPTALMLSLIHISEPTRPY